MKNTEQKIPALRFPEFSGEWEEKRLGEIGEIVGGGTPSTTNAEYWDGKIDWFTPSEIKQKYIFKSERKISEQGLKASSAKLLPRGTLLMTTRATIGEVSIALKECCTNQGFQSIITNKDNSNEFIYYFIKNSTPIFYKKANGSTFLEISKGEVEKLKVSFPSLPEQQKIADFLSAVDKRLQLLKDKKTKLEEYKRGVMQRIFSQELRFTRPDGSTYPDWEEKRLNQLIDQFIVPMRDKPKFLDGDIPWCRIEDFERKYLYKSKSNQGVNKNVVRDMNLKIYPINTLLVSCSANLGVCAIVKKELITNQTFIGLVPNHNLIYVEFLYYIMGLSSKRLNALSSGTTISYLSREEFEKFTIQYPCLDEQRQIADFLSVIDDKISLLNQQIASTEQYKKGLLQQMFV